MSATVKGPIDWNMARDEEGHRTYSISFLVQTTDTDDDPATVMNASGAPAIGSTWAYGNGIDLWAFCWPTLKVERYKALEGDPHTKWKSTYTFSTKPLRRCQDNSIENPINEPFDISGSFVKYTKKVEKDRNGDTITTTSNETIQLEKDANRHQLKISYNSPTLNLSIITAQIDTINDNGIWGLPAKTAKFSDFSWSRKLYGTCTFYYTLSFSFDIKYEGWDVDDALNAGWMVRKGSWVYDAGTSKHTWTPAAGALVANGDVIRFEDHKGVPIPHKWPLNDDGDPIFDPADHQFIDPAIELYDESNFLTLGVPSTF